MSKDDKQPKFTIKQRRFADEFIACGNLTEAARRAGYKAKGSAQAHQVYNTPHVREYIDKRLKEQFEQQTMTMAEALALTSSIARGEVQHGYSKIVDKLTGEVTKEEVYQYIPTITDQQRSLEHIFKINGAFIDNKQIQGEIATELKVMIDYGD